jgi:hypothetical protein
MPVTACTDVLCTISLLHSTSCGSECGAVDAQSAESPLHWAVEGGHAPVVRLLLKAKACVHATDQVATKHGCQPTTSQLNAARMFLHACDKGTEPAGAL